MYARCTDEETFKRFWREERDNMPRWFVEACDTWHCTESAFLDFCRGCERLYLLGQNAILYVERLGESANIHFSLIRGTAVDMDDLLAIRDELLKDYEVIFGWCGNRNKGLKAMLEACGLQYRGLQMTTGYSHGRPLTYNCFAVKKNIDVTANSC